jgi:hypothetical protein
VPAEIADGIDVDLPPGVFEITLGADDLPTKLTLTVDGTSAHHSEDVTFSDWGAEITISVPAGKVDETPWVDEEAVAAAAAVVTPMAPTVVPDGLVLTYIEGYTAEELDESCPQLNIGYWPPIEDTAATEAFNSSPDSLTTVRTRSIPRSSRSRRHRPTGRRSTTAPTRPNVISMRRTPCQARPLGDHRRLS